MSHLEPQPGMIEDAKRITGALTVAVLGTLAANVPSAYADISQDPVSPMAPSHEHVVTYDALDAPIVVNGVSYAKKGTSPKHKQEAGTTYEPEQTTSNVERIAGQDRVATSIEISQAAHPDHSVYEVFLVSGLKWADAISISPVAAEFNEPILLATPDPDDPTKLDKRTMAEIKRVLKDQPSVSIDRNIYIIGGTAAVDASFEYELASDHTSYEHVYRIAGNNRYETAAKVGKLFFYNPKKAIVANGEDYKGALLGASAASAGIAGPVVFSEGSTLPEATSEYLNGLEAAEPNGALVSTVGAEATAAVPDEDKSYVGKNIYDTGVMLENAFSDSENGSKIIAFGGEDGWPDVLTGIAKAASEGGFTLIVAAKDLPGTLDTFLRELSKDYQLQVELYGGTAVISSTVQNQIESATSSS